ncbi:3-keto-disaccharide hydrolase [Urechidicola croceus]|uniref:Glycosyl hydrolase n=1 Tax=Urechidicola croceus TaxID=1850246 RepID=A0A1D8PAG5_9FLAO|nr:DUF1080 domain-containing protein [Urechidicola croceus]AOW21536.1 glycosyl hydrolase [Urechidicola croceus]
MKRSIVSFFVLALVLSCNCKDKPTTTSTDNVSDEITTKVEFVSLFDGKSFTGWHLYNGGELNTSPWKIENEVLSFTGRKGGSSYNLVTDKEFTNFKLSLEWKISEGGNSGIMWGVQEDLKYGEPYLTGPEIQVLHNEKHPDGKYPTHHAGALYDMITPPSNVTKPVGEWNKCEIIINHKTNEGKVWLNGVVTAEFPVYGEKWDEMVANSKFKDWEGFGKFQTGKICLQDHEDKVWYRNIKIQEL